MWESPDDRWPARIADHRMTGVRLRRTVMRRRTQGDARRRSFLQHLHQMPPPSPPSPSPPTAVSAAPTNPASPAAPGRLRPPLLLHDGLVYPVVVIPHLLGEDVAARCRRPPLLIGPCEPEGPHERDQDRCHQQPTTARRDDGHRPCDYRIHNRTVHCRQIDYKTYSVGYTPDRTGPA